MEARVRHIATILLSLIVGGVFIFSGFVKSVDPVGTSIFVEKYLATYSLEALIPLALIIAVVLGAVELMLGIMLVVGAYRSRAAFGATLFLVIFTIITLLSATILPIGDCGCFGDAVKLTPWQTFAKNLVLLPLAFALWWLSRRGVCCRYSLVTTLVALLFAAGVNLIALRFLPLIDFLPYKVGVELREEVSRVYSVEDELDRSVLLFRDITTGESVEFSADATECWEDANLEYVDAYMVHEKPPQMTFSDFKVYDADGNDVTLSLLERKGSVVWLCINDVDALNGRRLSAAKRVVDEKTIIISSESAERVGDLLGMPCYAMDAMTLRSFIRADVGIVVISDGVIAHKCDVRDFQQAMFNLSVLARV